MDGAELVDVLVSGIHNHLDRVKVNIIPPGGTPLPIESHNVEHVMCLETYRVRKSKATLDHDLTVHEKGLYSSSQSYFILSQPGETIIMPMFPNLDCPICHACKVNCTTHAPGGSERTKNSARLCMNLIKGFPTLVKSAFVP